MAANLLAFEKLGRTIHEDDSSENFDVYRTQLGNYYPDLSVYILAKN